MIEFIIEKDKYKLAKMTWVFIHILIDDGYSKTNDDQQVLFAIPMHKLDIGSLQFISMTWVSRMDNV